MDLLGNAFIHNAVRSRLSPQMAKLCKERINRHASLTAGDQVTAYISSNIMSQGFSILDRLYNPPKVLTC